MYSDEFECQFCTKKVKVTETWSKPFEGMPHDLSPIWLNVCSTDCVKKLYAAQDCFKFRYYMRNIQRLPFCMFQDVFQFPEAGGYAEDMYERMKRSPFGFLCSLDDQNYLKLVRSAI